MSLPSTYLTSTKNLKPILDAIKTAQAPKQFSTRFLLSLGFKSSGDRLVIGVLKALRFLNDQGQPTERYFQFLDASQSASVLADGIRDAYSDLFAINVNAHTLGTAEVKNKLKTLTQGQHSDSVLGHMSRTFKALTALADFSPVPAAQPQPDVDDPAFEEETPPLDSSDRGHVKPLSLDGLIYNINLVLPDSRDPAVYDALFESLARHLHR